MVTLFCNVVLNKKEVKIIAITNCTIKKSPYIKYTEIRHKIFIKTINHMLPQCFIFHLTNPHQAYLVNN